MFTEPQSDCWRGENKRDALFVAIGLDFTTGSVDDLTILDLAPTFLHLHGLGIPDAFDGRVRMELYGQNTDASGREVEYCEAATVIDDSKIASEEGGVRERL